MRKIAGPAQAAEEPEVTVGSEATRTGETGRGRRARRRGASRPPVPILPSPGTATSGATVLPGGRTVRVRAASLGDGARLRRMFSRLSPRSIYRRFHSPLPRVPDWAVTRAVEVDHHDRESLVAVVEDEIVGHATYARLGGGREAEVAVVVEDGWQRRGVGKRLLSELAGRARRRGIEAFTGAVLPENGAMRGLLAASGGGLRYSVEDGAYVARIPVTYPGNRLGASALGTDGDDHGTGHRNGRGPNVGATDTSVGARRGEVPSSFGRAMPLTP